MERRCTDEAIDAAILMKFATTVDPYSLSPRAYDPWAENECNYGTELISAWEQAGLEPSSKLRTQEKLWQGISDTAEIIHNALDDYGKPLTEEEAIAVVRHDMSINTIAHAAQLGEKSLRHTNHRQRTYNEHASDQGSFRYFRDVVTDPVYSRRFIIDGNIGAIIQNPAFDEGGEFRHPGYGCPFAHGETKRPKVFDSFVRWAGTLAVREYYANKK
jgi:hypothetical protein